MKSLTLGLALSLFGTMAMAQTPPAPPAPAAPAPGAQAQPVPPGPGAPAHPAPAVPGVTAAMPTPNGPPEGMIVETPNGFYLVRPGDATPRKLDLAQAPQNQPPGMQAGPGLQVGPADDMADMPDEEMQPPHPHRPPPHPPAGKGASFRIQTPKMTVAVKCPDDEPVKACVDAISQLLDKAAAQNH